MGGISLSNLRNDIELELSSNLIKEWCKQRTSLSSTLFYEDANSSKHIIRFSTYIIESIFPKRNDRSGYWKNGHLAFYEIVNDADALVVRLVVSLIGISKSEKLRLEKLLFSIETVSERNSEFVVITEWNLLDLYPENIDKISTLQSFYNIEFLYFENQLKKWVKNNNYSVKQFPLLDLDIVTNKDVPDTIYIEGALKQILLNKYERNRDARKRCIAIHGTSCAICGFDFSDVYGNEFAGKIEVHHIVPLAAIKEDYVVDPDKDLIPVCPNCHMVLHSKKHGVYTIEEVKRFLSKE